MIVRCTDSSDSEGQQIPVRVVAGLQQLELIGVGAVEVRTIGLRALMNFINLLYGLCIYKHFPYIYIYIYICMENECAHKKNRWQVFTCLLPTVYD